MSFVFRATSTQGCRWYQEGQSIVSCLAYTRLQHQGPWWWIAFCVRLADLLHFVHIQRFPISSRAYWRQSLLEGGRQSQVWHQKGLYSSDPGQCSFLYIYIYCIVLCSFIWNNALCKLMCLPSIDVMFDYGWLQHIFLSKELPFVVAPHCFGSWPHCCQGPSCCQTVLSWIQGRIHLPHDWD